MTERGALDISKMTLFSILQMFMDEAALMPAKPKRKKRVAPES